MTTMAELSVNSVSKKFTHGSTQTTILTSANALFSQQYTYALTGASGTGKSTVMHLLAGIDTPDSGSITFNNKNILSLQPHERRDYLNRSIGLMFQQPYLISELTVIENVIVP